MAERLGGTALATYDEVFSREPAGSVDVASRGS
jgi:hypothetical protein